MTVTAGTPAAAPTPAPSAASVPPRRGRRRGPGWVPDQHGAWAMVAVPPLLGVLLAGPAPIHLVLLPLWWVGFFLFFAGGLYLRSHGKARYLRPVLVYGAATAVLGVVLLLLEPALAVWALPYLPLIAATAVLSWQRKDRSMLNDTVTVGAAGLMTAVAFHAGSLAGSVAASSAGADPRWPWVWVVTALMTAYFLGTVFYVKTNIRERDSRGWLVASIGYHAALTALVTLAALAGWEFAGHTVPLAHALVWALATARAAAVPLVRARPGSPAAAVPAKRWAMIIGIGEAVFCVLMPLSLLFG